MIEDRAPESVEAVVIRLRSSVMLGRRNIP